MALKRGPLTGNLDIHARYSIEPDNDLTGVVRTLDVTMQLPGLMKLAKPIIIRGLRKENLRILAELKRFVESGKS